MDLDEEGDLDVVLELIGAVRRGSELLTSTGDDDPRMYTVPEKKDLEIVAERYGRNTIKIPLMTVDSVVLDHGTMTTRPGRDSYGDIMKMVLIEGAIQEQH